VSPLNPSSSPQLIISFSAAVPPVSLVVPNIHIHLYEQYYITCTINQYSGRLELKAVGEVSTQWEARLRNAADKVDRDRKTAAETISRVRASVSPSSILLLEQILTMDESGHT
jgi:hypothetical protein